MENKSFCIRMIPTLVSLLAVALGVTAIKCAFEGNFEAAAFLIVLAAILDNFDGRIARALGVASDFGVQIDSLADAVNFGVSPAFVVYLWKMSESDHVFFGWLPVLLLVFALIIRLARFNSDLSLDDPESPLIKYFFKGMPAPSVALMTLFPLIASFEFGDGFWTNPASVIINTIIMALFAVSKIPTPCLKKLHFTGTTNFVYKNTLRLLILLILIGFIPQIPFTPWFGLTITGLVYLVGIVISIIAFNKIQNKYA
ncbi:MAG: CDP-alcohol phosphatidyltransferase family protein [Rickettsiales bacterium]|jgi:CDP-diacylglycerol--serine O-phosphatidyltransferase|nr:CDP-alcohol phosphatidyltransferase family protein [Rickettsiales bacterium]